MNQVNQYGLCLCCGTPFKPTIEDMIDHDFEFSTSILQIAKLVRNNNEISQKMNPGRELYFLQDKQAAHMIHKTHHMRALNFVQDLASNRWPNSRQTIKFPFFQTPTSRRSKPFIAEWTPLTESQVIPLQNMVDFMKSLPIADSDPAAFDMQNNLQVDTCRACNTCMTMEFWYRYLLYTSINTNNTRIIQASPIRIFESADNNIDFINWRKKPNQQPQIYPKPKYSRDNDYFGAYIAYYLHMCYPFRATTTSNASSLQKKLAKKVCLKLAWITLEVACLVCEFKFGASNSGKYNQLTKCLRGAIELYTSYFAWTLACYEYTTIQNLLTFAQWHQYYATDMTNCSSFKHSGIKIISDQVIPNNNIVFSRILITQINERLIECYSNHYRKILLFLQNANNLSPLDSHYFIPLAEIQIIEQNTYAASMAGIEKIVKIIGIQASWDRVMELCCDFPLAIRQEMNNLRNHFINNEIHNLYLFFNIPQANAEIQYTLQCVNPVDNSQFRSRWASVIDLHLKHAL